MHFFKRFNISDFCLETDSIADEKGTGVHLQQSALDKEKMIRNFNRLMKTILYRRFVKEPST